jgi:uncharacterized protein
VTRRIVFAALLLGLVAPSARAASFDCAKASHATEKAICGDRELSKLDEEMAAAWRARREALAGDPAALQAFKDEHLAWVKSTRAKGMTAAALRDSYRARITALAPPEEGAGGGEAGAEAVQEVAIVERLTERTRTVDDREVTLKLVLPEIVGPPDPLSEAWQRAISSFRGKSTDEWISEFENATDDCSFEAGHKVVVNDGGVLSVEIWSDAVCASNPRPNGDLDRLSVNLAAGRRVAFADVFKPASKGAVLALVNAAMQKGIRDAAKRAPDEAAMILRTYANRRFTAEELESSFFLKEDGILFWSGFYGLGGMSMALEPLGQYELQYAELAPHLRKDGLLGRHAR